MKRAMKQKIRSLFKNWKASAMHDVKKERKAGQVDDGIGDINNHTKLQKFVRHNHPTYPDSPLPMPQDLIQVEYQAANVLKIRPDCERSRSSNRFITLEVPTDEQISEKDPNGKIRGGIMVFSTIALLYNVVISHCKYKNVALGSVDVTHSIGASKKCVLAFCLISNTDKGSQRVSPVSYAMVTSESVASTTSTILATKMAIKRLWNVDLVLRVGTIADHSNTLYESLTHCFRNTVHANCWMHFKMKVRTDRCIYMCG